MPTALIPRDVLPPAEAPAVTTDQLELIKRTVANGATPDELKLYLYDCARQGVHPLDKLIHFTKRGGKYTPITSIDFMRTRAADTNEYAGSDDAAFSDDGCDSGVKPVTAATVTVWRLVQGQRCSFTATARWSEYCPGQGQDHMWRKMPHTMLAKCAEALALRKGFPRQLAGLYAKEELDQADSTSRLVIEAPAAVQAVVVPSKPNGGDSDSRPSGAELLGAATLAPDSNLPPGAVYVTKVEAGNGKTKGFLHHSGQPVSLHGMDGIGIFDERWLTIASEVCQSKTPVMIETVNSKTSGKPYVTKITTVKPAPSDAELDAEVARRELALEAGKVL